MVEKNILDNLTGQEIKEMIDRNEITLEQLDASTLRKLMNYETDMLCIGEGDVDLICKCSDLLDKIDPNPMTSEEFMNIIERSKTEHITIIDEDTNHNNVPKARFILKRTALIAAIIMILMTSTVAIASAFGFDICKYISEIVREPEGTESNVDEFTFYHNGETKKYNSIEDMIESENLDIMYPAKFPNGVLIDNIQMLQLSNGNSAIQIFTNNTISITIELSSIEIDSSNTNILEYNGVIYYIKNENDIFIACCNHNGNTYSFITKSKEDLMIIIENMKE